MIFESINPHNGQVVGTHKAHSDAEVDSKLSLAATAFTKWKNVPITERAALLIRVGELLKQNVEEYAAMITLEMGKPIKESRGEVLKCVTVCDYYAKNAEHFLADEEITTDAHKSYVRHDPIGSVLAIMPWNFPFWQVLRFAAPTLMAGNTGILKHAPNVFGCAKLIEKLFTDAGFPEGVFQNLLIHHDQTEKIIAHPSVQAVTLTGSTRAGKAVAELAGRHLKKSLLELGGNNAFIVWEDADIDRAVKTAITARMMNCGQSCIAAKRFILVDQIYEEFVAKYTAAIDRLSVGDPSKEDTNVGPLARRDLADQLHEQVQKSINQGAVLLRGGNQRECYYEPTILGNVEAGMTVFEEETFGPVAAMIRVKNSDEAIDLAERSIYGLGVTVCTRNIEDAMLQASRVSDGAYFVNELVKSDARLPFGGTKQSGYGRELSRDGILEFVNRKTVYVKQ